MKMSDKKKNNPEQKYFKHTGSVLNTTAARQANGAGKKIGVPIETITSTEDEDKAE